MIDKNGTQIRLDAYASDPSFIIKEISFQMKGFRRNQSEEVALTMGERLVTYLRDCDQPHETAMDFLTEMEDYAAETKNVSLLWQLIYARRELCSKAGRPGDGSPIAAEHRRIAAHHFITMVCIEPSAYNMGAAVIELIAAAMYCTVANMTAEADECLELAWEKFMRMIPEKPKESSHLMVGERLYLGMKVMYSKIGIRIEELDINLSLANYACKVYALNPNRASLIWATKAYISAFSLPMFPYEEEKEQIERLLVWLRATAAEGDKEIKVLLKHFNNGLELHLRSEGQSE